MFRSLVMRQTARSIAQCVWGLEVYKCLHLPSPYDDADLGCIEGASAEGSHGYMEPVVV